MEMLVMILVLALAAIALWHLVDQWDRRCIAEYICQRGGRVVSIKWSSRETGWFGKQTERPYEVVYHDHDGNLRLATCRVKALRDVRITDDRITHWRKGQRRLSGYKGASHACDSG